VEQTWQEFYFLAPRLNSFVVSKCAKKLSAVVKNLGKKHKDVAEYIKAVTKLH